IEKKNLNKPTELPILEFYNKARSNLKECYNLLLNDDIENAKNKHGIPDNVVAKLKNMVNTYEIKLLKPSDIYNKTYNLMKKINDEAHRVDGGDVWAGDMKRIFDNNYDNIGKLFDKMHEEFKKLFAHDLR